MKKLVLVILTLFTSWGALDASDRHQSIRLDPRQPQCNVGILLVGKVSGSGVYAFPGTYGWQENTRNHGSESSQTKQEQKGFFIASADSGYVDPVLCASCHQDIYETYRQTGMGRSFFRPRSENTVEDYTKNNIFYHKASDRYYKMYQRDGKYYQQRYQIGFDGREINVVEKEVHFVVGSGNHGRTYLHRTKSGALVQLPLGWYAEKEGYWGMSPGYDRPDHQGFRRKINHSCMFCHNGYPQIESGSDASGTDPIFKGTIPEGINCQRCHGPGHDHIQALRRGQPLEAIRRAIVNPARLSPERQLEVCMQCHLESTTSPLPAMIRRYDRPAFSYRPGEPLEAYVLHFDRPAGVGYDNRFEINHAAYRLRKSACFQKSNGSMTCTTCHDPHRAPRSEAAVRGYTRACVSCHVSTLDKLVAANLHTSNQDCIDCHMPRRRADDVVHGVMTDHYIQRRKPARDLLAPRQEVHETEETSYRGEVVLYYPPQLPLSAESELYLAVAQVKQGTNLKEGIRRLEKAIEKHRPERCEFYFELADAYLRAGEIDKAIEFHEEALRRKPDYLPALRNFGMVLSQSAQISRGIEVLKKTLAIAPEDTITLSNLGLAYYNQDMIADAIATLRKALSVDPDLPDAHNNLGLALAHQGKPEEAIAAFREAIRLEPNFARAHYNLGLNLYRRARVEEAIAVLQKAVQIDPNLAIAHVNLGVSLASQGRVQEAIAAFRKALQIDRTLAIAHVNLGVSLAHQGKLDEAIAEFHEAIRLKPNDKHLKDQLKKLEEAKQGKTRR